MKTRLTHHLMAVLISVVFTAELHAQLPNAWQINDHSTAQGSLVYYYTNLTAAQFNGALANGWRFRVTCRMVASYGSAHGATYVLFGDGTNRYGYNLNLDPSGRLVINPVAGSQLVLTPVTSTATNYHTHELDYNPATRQVTYYFDGTPLTNWSAQSSPYQSHEAVWGSDSSTDEGQMNFHRVQFAIAGLGEAAVYDAGFAGNPAVAPSPANQDWTRYPGAVAIPEGPVSPDSVPLPSLVTTLPATAVTSNTATLNAVLDLGTGPTVYYFEYGLTTNYGAFTMTNTISTGGFSTNASEDINDLSLATTYHFRAIATNTAGVFSSRDTSFSTTPFIVVSSLGDNGPGTLRSAVALANTNISGAFIMFDPSLSGQTIVLTNGELLLSNWASLDASSLPGGIAISGNQSSRIFEISSNADVLLDSLILRDGAAPDGNYPANSGSGILNYGQLALDNCTLQNNQATNGSYPSGGGIENFEGTLMVSNCLFAGNSAGSSTNNPGDGGGILNNRGILFISHSTFSDNSASGDAGGGGIFNSESSTLTVSDCTFSSNSASGDYRYGGGGIFNAGKLTLNNSALTGNSAPGSEYGGGGIFNAVDLTLNNSTLTGNSAPDSGYGGGGIENEGGLTLNNSTFTGNSASGSFGGGIYNGNSLALTNSILAGNTADTGPNLYSRSNASVSGVNNLTNSNPLLAPLANYGGPTQTMPPLFGSPAIDTGSDSVTTFLATDQRGYPRKSGAHVDIGAVEAQYAPANNPLHLMNAASSGTGGNNSFQFTFTNNSDADYTVLASTNLALPLTEWIPIGNAVQNSPGQFHYTDPAATNSSQRFYRVVSP